MCAHLSVIASVEMWHWPQAHYQEELSGQSAVFSGQLTCIAATINFIIT